MPYSAVEFSCEVLPDRDRAIVRVGGELDLAVAPRVAAAVDELVDVGFTRVVIDLRGLTFLDSAGVHTIASAHRSAGQRGCAVSLVPGSGAVQRVLELTGAAPLLPFDDEREAA
jgi:anti-sigma B factor antagonist